MTNQEMLNEAVAAQRLERMGYARILCERCGGTGKVENHAVITVGPGKVMKLCGACGGDQYIWKEPIAIETIALPARVVRVMVEAIDRAHHANPSNATQALLQTLCSDYQLPSQTCH